LKLHDEVAAAAQMSGANLFCPSSIGGDELSRRSRRVTTIGS
jgi:hypothetical protein